MDPIQAYRSLLEKKKQLETSVATSQGVLKSKEETFEKFKSDLQANFPGVKTLQDLEALLATTEKEIQAVVTTVQAECPELLA